LFLGLTAATAAVEAFAGSPIACGALHTIERGETLFKIADRAYDDGWQYKRIFEVNRDVLPDEKSIEIGDQILIPCLDGTGPRTRRAAMAQTSLGAIGGGRTVPPHRASAGPPQSARNHTAGTTATGVLRRAAAVVQGTTLSGKSLLGAVTTDGEAVATTTGAVTSDSALRLLISRAPAPYAGETLPRGGLIPEIISRAVHAATPEQRLGVDVVNDWSGYLNRLLLDDAFDVALPWYKPACATPERLGAAGKLVCSRFEFSRAIVEVPFSYYVRSDNSVLGTRDYGDLFNQRLCRVEGPVPFTLEENGLAEPTVSIHTADTAAECFVQLSQNDVDVVAVTAAEAGRQIRDLGISRAVSEIEGLRSMETLHALVLKSNPRGRVYLDQINRGLTTLMASGTWFKIVTVHQGLRLSKAE
jgi:hypothetical protein